MKSLKIKQQALVNNCRPINIIIAKNVLRECYTDYLNKRRLNNLPVEEDLKLITYVRHAIYCQVAWVLEKEVTDSLVKDYFL